MIVAVNLDPIAQEEEWHGHWVGQCCAHSLNKLAYV
jgi:hypothetical protein